MRRELVGEEDLRVVRGGQGAGVEHAHDQTPLCLPIPNRPQHCVRFRLIVGGILCVCVCVCVCQGPAQMSVEV